MEGMLHVQGPVMATSYHNAEGSHSRADRPPSTASSYSTSSSVASSTFVHPASMKSFSVITNETDDSTISSLDVLLPQTPSDYDLDPQQMPYIHVLCMYDFDSEDPGHTSFRKNDILKVIAREPSGWWAAQVGEHIGWIPSAFVTVIPYDMVDALQRVPHDLRLYEYEAETLYSTVPMSALTLNGKETPPEDQLQYSYDNEQEIQMVSTTSHLVSPLGFPTDVTPAVSRFDIPKDLPEVHSPDPDFLTDPWHNSRHNRPYSNVPRTPVPPKVPAPEPSTVDSATVSQVHPRPAVPPLRVNTKPPLFDKPTPPTPISTTPLSPQPQSSNYSPTPILPRSRSLGSSSVSGGGRRRPDALLFNPASLKHLSALVETPFSHKDTLSEVEVESVVSHGSPQTRNTGLNKVWRITGDDDAQAFHNAKLAQAAQPWYLKPQHLGDEIKMDNDGSIRAGTLEALVERLTVEPLKVEQEKTFRHTFLLTFHTFTTALRVLELLIERYEMESPLELVEEQFIEWKDKKLRPTQARVLHVFSLWVEEYGMVEDDPQIIPRLRDFLELVRSPTALVQSAKHIQQALDLRRHSDINLPQLASTTPARRGTRKYRNDLLRIEPAELARQLTLYEARLYLKVRPHECLTWAGNQKGESVQNLRAFVSTSDKVAAWVKNSVLSNDALGKRANTIELWIKVADKCRALNNYSSMSAIVAALTSQVIAKLQLTWAHVNKTSHVEPLVKLSEPSNNFATYRHLFSSTDGPCLPYIGIYLSDMVKVSETAPNFIKVPSSDSASELSLINFMKRQRMGEVANTILRHQPKVRDSYKITEVTQVLQYIENQLRIAAGKDEGSFWMRSQEVQHAELAHADIRKGLEAAGF